MFKMNYKIFAIIWYAKHRTWANTRQKQKTCEKAYLKYIQKRRVKSK